MIQTAARDATPIRHRKSSPSRSREGEFATLFLTVLTIATLAVHGFHPLAEDGGLYVAGVEWTLNHSLFPHFTAFVTEHLRFSIFAPVVAALVRTTHLPLLSVLFALNLASTAFTLAAGYALLRRVTFDVRAQLAGVALLAATWTIPIAGTSLLFMDPYVTARSVSTPLSLFALAFALDDWRLHTRSWIGCALSILVAAAFHPLMAGYALGMIVVVRLLRSSYRVLSLTLLGLFVVVGCAILQAHAVPDSPAVALAARSRYYWFLSQWRWYELLGLAGPLLVLAALLRWGGSALTRRGASLAFASILYGSFAVGLALVFAHESFRAHLIARLQPLRVFLLIYGVMFLLLGATLQQWFDRLAAASTQRRILRFAMFPLTVAAALAMFMSQCCQFPSSPHVELPWRLAASPNPWVQALLWCRTHTPPDALFALDAHYITATGEDAQTFRAIARRSSLPDFSKDGGEAAITPRLADQWSAGFHAQLDLNQQTAQQLRTHLRPFGVDWVVLRSHTPAQLTCPYDNGSLRVCELQP